MNDTVATPEQAEQSMTEFSGSSVIKYSVTDSRIAELKTMYQDFPTDLTVKDNYKFVQKGVSVLRGLRNDVEKRRKELKAGALEYGRKVDSEAKRIMDSIQSIEEPMASAKKDFDAAVEAEKRERAAAEERRIDGIAARIAGIKVQVEAHISSPSERINEAINKVSAEQQGVDEWAMEFSGKAMTTIEETLQRLNELLTMRLSQEEQARMAAEAEERRRIEEEERRAEETRRMAEEKARLEEEKARLEEERKKLAEEQRLQEAAIAEERRKMEESARKAEEDARLRREAEEKELAEQRRLQDENIAAEQLRLEDERAKMGEERQKGRMLDLQSRIEQLDAEDAKPQQQDKPILTPHAARQMAGKAIMQIVKDFSATKALLDAITNGAIPYIHFTEK